MDTIILNRIDSLFYDYLNNKDANWKHIVSELYSLTEKTIILSQNARNGLYYLNGVIYNQLCSKCDDTKAFKWLANFSKAWLEKKELPLFDKSCWEESCE